MQIHCPHCDGLVELANNANGLFECPHCGDEFEWGDNTLRDLHAYFYTFLNRYFWFGLLTPFLVSMIFLILTGIIVNPTGWDVLLYFSIAVQLYPLAAIVLIIYGLIRGDSSITIGASSALALLLVIWSLIILIGF